MMARRKPSRPGRPSQAADVTTLPAHAPVKDHTGPARLADASGQMRGKTLRRLRVALEPERGWSITTVFFIVLAVVALSQTGTLPTLTGGLVFLAMCYGWNLVGGMLGELSLAHMIFWGIGGYGTVLVINHSQPILPWLVVLVILGALAGAMVAGLISVTGLTGLLPVAIFTLVLGQIAYTFAQGNGTLGGAEGLVVHALPPYSPQVMFLFILVIAAVAAAANLAVSNSRFGRELLAIRDDRVAATVAGINVGRQRYLIYMLSAALFALGGAYQSYYAGDATPDLTLGITSLILVTLSIFVGGPGTAMGPLIGAIIIYGLQAATQQASTSVNAALYAQLAAYGAALILLRLVFPRLKGVDLSTAIVRGLWGMKRHGARKPDAEAPSAPASELAASILAVSEPAAPAAPGGAASRNGHGLELVDVRKSFGRLDVLRGVSFSIRPGELVGIVGPNGAGKSTLCNLISGVERPSAGVITVGGRDVTSVPVHRRSSHGMGRSFQTPRLFASLSLADNLTLARHHMSEMATEDVLLMLGIPDGLHRRGNDSQFLARRLTEVTKAAMQGSSVLMLDEPLAGLTASEHEIVLEMARQAASSGACVGIVEHLIPVLAPAVDRIVVLHQGRIIADGPPESVLQKDEVVEAYLGKPHTMEESQ
jgi:branched-chain amino acid transport system permease protein